MGGAAPAMARIAPQEVQNQSPVYLDKNGTIRWRSTNAEVRLFGANYSPFAGSDYRMAGLLQADRKAMIDSDMAHFARMGWDGLRLCSWGDWENTDKDGNLIENDHLDLLEYVIAKAAERGIQILLTPTATYSSGFADQLGNPDYKPDGFSAHFPRENLPTDPKAIASQKNYISQLLAHSNPYTGLAMKDQKNVIFIEMINEPVHNSKDIPQSISFIDGLVDAVRATGAKQLTFHNISQDFEVTDAILRSKVDGVTFGWYPSGLNSGHELKGNYLPSVRDFPPMRDPRIAAKPRLVYEFDQADLNTGYLFPAMARTFRAVGTQFAAIFSYDMVDTAPYNLSWQTHFINLLHTPRQALSAAIASEAMDRLTPSEANLAPEASTFGDFWVDYDSDASGLSAADAYMNAGDTSVRPKGFRKLSRIAGVGSSPVVSYEGTGAYFLDKVADGVWRLEVYPDQILVSDPFAQPRPDKIVSRLYSRSWPMSLHLPDLGTGFTIQPVTVPDARAITSISTGNQFQVRPGVWLLSRRGISPHRPLPTKIRNIRFDEFLAKSPPPSDDEIIADSGKTFTAGSPTVISVRFATQDLPPSLNLYVRPVRGRFLRPVQMQRTAGDRYSAHLEGLEPGLYEYIVGDPRAPEGRTYPGALAGSPGKWPFAMTEGWRFTVIDKATPLNIFNPATDLEKMMFPRATETVRGAIFKLQPGESSAESALRLSVPEVAGAPPTYAAGLYIGDRISGRNFGAGDAKAVAIRAKADGALRDLDLVFVEADGSAWGKTINIGTEWQTYTVALNELRSSKSMLLPTPYPGMWAYWRPAPASRQETRIQPKKIEQLELRVTNNSQPSAAETGTGVWVEAVDLLFETEGQQGS
jgi:hypothetical protein